MSWLRHDPIIGNNIQIAITFLLFNTFNQTKINCVQLNDRNGAYFPPDRQKASAQQQQQARHPDLNNISSSRVRRGRDKMCGHTAISQPTPNSNKSPPTGTGDEGKGTNNPISVI